MTEMNTSPEPGQLAAAEEGFSAESQIIAAPKTDGLDTVSKAEATPDVEQPWAELGLKDDEYARIREILGRRPTSAELAMYSVMWSEHCSYKSSKTTSPPMFGRPRQLP